jgi:hypothetical protein
MADCGLVGSVNKNRRINQYRNVSVFHGPNESLPNGSVWLVSMSPAGGYFGGWRLRDSGPRRANEAATTRAICSTWSGVRSAATTVVYWLLR